MARKPKEPSPNPSDIEYEVDKIVGHKFDDEDPDRVRYLYRIRWLNFTWKDDTWEPRESLEGGAEGILTEYQEERRKAGQVFFDEGAKKSKIPKYLAKYNVGPEVLTYDEGDGPEDEEVDQAAEEDDEEIEEAPVASKEKKRKQRESEAAAAAEPARNGSSKRSNDVSMEEDDRRTSSKKSRHTSQSPLPPPPSVLRGRDERDRLKQEKADRERAEKAKEEERLVAKKPSSKRQDDEVSSQSQSKNKKRPSSAAVDMDSEDDAAAAKEIESLKRSPLKETKADQRHSADTNSRKSHTQEVKESLSSIPAQQVQQPLLGSQIYAKDPSWEGLLYVESLEQGEGEAEEGGNEGGGSSNEYRWFIKWNDENLQDEWILNTLARIKFPQKLLTFYEDHLKFKSTPDDDDPVNGDDVAMD